MDNKQPKRTGRPGDTILGKIEQVAKGENWSVSVECRDFQGQPIADPEDHDFIVTIGESERDENPFAEFHIWDPQIELTDPAKATFTASFKRSDMVLLAEGNEYFINYWSEPKDKSIEGRVRQARDAIRLLPSVEPKFVSSGRLAAVGFPSLLGSTSLTPYEIDPRDGFSGGKAPMGFVATIDGVTEAIPDTLLLDRNQVVDRDITVSAFDARGDVRSTIFHQTTYPALSFVGLADVKEEAQDGGTVTVSLAGGWTGGYGNRTYTATSGAISGSNLILPISDAGTTTITLTATDEDGNTVPGTIQLTVEDASPVIVAPSAAGELPNQTFTEDTGIETLDASGDFTNGGGTLVFSLPTKPSGVTIDSETGVISFDADTMAVVSGASVVVRATNSAGFAESGFSLTLEAADVDEPFASAVVQIANREAALTTGALTEPTAIAVLMPVRHVAGSLNFQYRPFRFTRTGANESILGSDGAAEPYLSISYLVDGVAAGLSIDAQNVMFELDKVVGILVTAEVGGTMKIYTATDSGGLVLRKTSFNSIPTNALLPGPNTAFTVGKGDISFQISGVVFYSLPGGLPVGFDPVADADQFLAPDGHVADPSITNAYMGVEPIFDTRSYTAEDYSNSDATITGTGAITDIRAETSGSGGGTTPPPTGDGEVIHTAQQIIASDYQTVPNHNAAFFSDSDGLASGVTIELNRTGSIVPREVIGLRIAGLSWVQMATWGFIWSLDQTGSFRYNGRLPSRLHNRDYGTGFTLLGSWDAAGTKTIRCLVIPPLSSGLGAFVVTRTITVSPLSDLITAANTWVIVPSGIDMTPPAGNQVSSVDAARNACRDTGNNACILAPYGETLPMTATSGFDRSIRGVGEFFMFSAWGDSARGLPTIRTNVSSFNIQQSNDLAPERALFCDLRFKGDYDPVTGSGARGSTVMRINENVHLSINNVISEGNFETAKSEGESLRNSSILFYDFKTTDIEHYISYSTRSDCFGFRGCDLKRNTMAVNGREARDLLQPSNNPDHFIRYAHMKWFAFSANDAFSNAGWSVETPAEDGSPVMSHQGIRLGGNTAKDGIANVTDNAIEGGGVDTDGGGDGRFYAHALFNVAQNLVHMTANPGSTHGVGHSGLYFHDNIQIWPNAPYESYKSTRGFFANMDGSGADASWLDGAFNVFSNTFVYLRSDANTIPDRKPSADDLVTINFNEWKGTQYTTEFPVENNYDNVVWAPNATLQGESGPIDPEWISDGGQIGPDLLYAGYRMETAAEDGSFVFKPEYASPPNDSRLPYVTTGAPKAAGQLKSALDAVGRIKTADPWIGGVQPQVIEVS